MVTSHLIDSYHVDLYCKDILYIDYAIDFVHYQEDLDYLINMYKFNLTHNLTAIHENYAPNSG